MRCLPFAVALAAAPAVGAAEPAAELSTSAEYQTGDYGTGEEIETLTLRNTVRIQSGRFQAYGSLPWHRVEGPGNVVAGGGGLLGLPILTDPQQPAGRTVRDGIGDLRVGAGYTLDAPGEVGFTMSGEVKLPTASQARGLGTGEMDVTVGAEAARRFGTVTPFVGVSYTLPGDPEGHDLRSSLAARGGVAVDLAPGLRGHVSYGQARGLSPYIENERMLSTGLEARLSRRFSLGVSGGAGLTEGSPDVGAAVRLGWRIF